MDYSEIAQKMQERITLCRNLAASTRDPSTSKALSEIADQGQRDLDHLRQQIADGNKGG